MYFAPIATQGEIGPDPEEVETVYRESPERFLVERAHDHLFYEYCAKKFEISRVCTLFAMDRRLYLERDDIPEVPPADINADPNAALVKFSRFYKDFRERLSSEDRSLKGLPSYQIFQKAKAGLDQKLQALRKENHLLHKENLGVSSILLAMFSHGSFMHLFGNMLFLFLFGRYVESRIGHLNYLMAYLIFGGLALGIYAYAASDSYFQVMGASANVAAVMGAFYALFYHKKIRVFFFYLFYKNAELPVKTYMFLLFMLQEFVFSFTSEGNVAYMAHAIGLSFGAVYGFGYRKLRPVPDDYLYKEEEIEWQKAQDIKDHGAFVQACLKILRYHPKNKKALRALIEEILHYKKDLGDMPLEEELHLRRLIPIYLFDLYKDKDWAPFFGAIEKLPHSWSLPVCLSRFDQKALLEAIDRSIDDQRLISSIKLIQAFTERYQRSSKIYNLLKTLGSVVKHMEQSEANNKEIEKVRRLTSSRPLKNALKNLVPRGA